MDERLRQLNHAVAAAAEAWLSDPCDIGVYSRLVTAIVTRRSYLNPPLPVSELDISGPPIGAVTDEELLDALGDDAARAPVTVGQLLATDVRAAVSRLREPPEDAARPGG